ncbi:MAG: polymorphic toxin-type HINT domain-containing protein [Polyangiales bacterium]
MAAQAAAGEDPYGSGSGDAIAVPGSAAAATTTTDAAGDTPDHFSDLRAMGLEPPKHTGTGHGNLFMRLYLMTPFAFVTHFDDAKTLWGSALRSLGELPKLLGDLFNMATSMAFNGQWGALGEMGSKMPGMMVEGYKYDVDSFINGDLEQAGRSGGYLAMDVLPVSSYIGKAAVLKAFTVGKDFYTAARAGELAARLSRPLHRLGKFDSFRRLAESDRFADLRTTARSRATGLSDSLRTKATNLREQIRSRFARDAADGCTGGRCTRPGQCFVEGTEVRTAAGARPIESLALGQRVETLGVAAPTAVDATWKRVDVRMPLATGDSLEISMLKPADWIAASVVDGHVALDLDEMAIHGTAEVLAVLPAPAIEPGDGFVVTATYARLADDVLDLSIEGESTPLGVTARHRFYSVTRDAWVRAGELEAGEVLKTESGEATVTAIAPRSGLHRVHNIEVEQEHTYLVGETRLYTHNQYAAGQGASADDAAFWNLVNDPENGLGDMDEVTIDRLFEEYYAGDAETRAAMDQIHAERMARIARAEDVVDAQIATVESPLGPVSYRAEMLKTRKELVSLTDALLGIGMDLRLYSDESIGPGGGWIRISIDVETGKPFLALTSETGAIPPSTIELAQDVLREIGPERLANMHSRPQINLRLRTSDTTSGTVHGLEESQRDVVRGAIDAMFGPKSGPDDVPPHPRHGG